MSKVPPLSGKRHTEAERLIELARRMLDHPEEEMVVNYLDHAIETLRMFGQDHQPPGHARSTHPVKCPPKVSAPDRGSPAPSLARPAEQ